MNCDKCGSDKHVKPNNYADVNGYPYLCRACRFDESVKRRNAPQHLYRIKYTFCARGPVFWWEGKAASAMQAIESLHKTFPKAIWEEVYSIQLVRRNNA